jgi:hypothetical protein
LEKAVIHGLGQMISKKFIATQLRSGLPSGFDPAIWNEQSGINNGFPYLIANPPQK